MNFILRARIFPAVIFLMMAIAAFGCRVAEARDLPSNSVYRLDLALVDQNGQASKLADLRNGGPVLIAMFYSSCKYVCPLIIDNLQRTERALSDSERARLRVVMVSFDPKRDTPAALKALANERHVDQTRWKLTRTEAAGVRKLAAVLDVQYRALDNGEFNHSSVITLLDGEGRIITRTDRMGELDPEFAAAVRNAAAGER
jgi:protein SCO1/2